MKPMIFPKELSGVKRISFFGLGKSNLSLLNTLPLDGIAVRIRSEKPIDEELLPKSPKIESVYIGERAFSDIDEELIVTSPSLRRERRELCEAAARGVRFTSDAELFFSQGDLRPVIGITGSDGKSTTATLVFEMLSRVKNTALIGNIGAPMYESLSTGAECFVAELSSFMLRYLKTRLECAAITSLSPNHLNWHSSLSEYKETKLSILDGAKRAVLSADSPLLPIRSAFALTGTKFDYETLKNCTKCEYYFTYRDGFIERNGERLVSADSFLRKEGYYIKNCLTALAVCEGVVPLRDRLEVISSFGGLRHRCEKFLCAGGIDFIDSSIDTSPERCRATLESVEGPVLLILGGRGKGASYAELAAAIEGKVRTVVATGEDADKIYKELGGVVSVLRAPLFHDAVSRAVALARCGDAVLLSPAATSYDAFSSFEERGREFKKIVSSLMKTENGK